MSSFFLTPRHTALDGNGKPISGAKLYAYTAGTTTPVTTYSDNALSTAHASPVVADSNGLFPAIFLNSGNYKFRLTDSSDVDVWVNDNISPPLPGDNGTIAVANGGTGAANATLARTNLGAASAADVTSLTSSVTDLEAEIVAAGGSLSTLAGKSTIQPTDLGSNFGNAIIQVKNTIVAEQSTASTVIPQDATAPTNTEGTELIDVAITPKYAASLIEITAQTVIGNSGGIIDYTLAVFSSQASTAISSKPIYFEGTRTLSTSLLTYHSPNTTSEVTYSLRGGPGTSRSMEINGTHYGGTAQTIITAKEIYSV